MVTLDYPNDIESKSDIADLTPDGTGYGYSDEYVDLTDVVEERIIDLVGLIDEEVLVPKYKNKSEVPTNMLSQEAKIQSAKAMAVVDEELYLIE